MPDRFWEPEAVDRSPPSVVIAIEGRQMSCWFKRAFVDSDMYRSRLHRAHAGCTLWEGKAVQKTMILVVASIAQRNTHIVP